jgi:galactokinase
MTGTPADLTARTARAYAARFGAEPEVTVFAPGRVNLLGEHTDYNGGLVLPMPLSLGVAVAAGRGGVAGRLLVASDSFESEETRALGERATGAWSDYVLGSVAAAMPPGADAGLRMLLASDLPVGAGLSSSAAVEVATLRAMHGLAGREEDPVETARAARGVENDFVGMPCGIMDQFAVSVGTPGRALLLDTRRLAHREVGLPEDHRVVVVHSGVSHRLTDDGYATRVAECEAACAALGVEVLSDLGPEDLDRIARLAPPLDRRARHVVTENRRVRDAVAALEVGDAAGFGGLMVESHASQRDDYAVSVPEVDALVAAALDLGATGARLTGGGFGGSIVALVEEATIPGFREAIAGRAPAARVLAVA